MRIVFVSDSFHLHQKGVADELYDLTKGSYCFITTLPLSEERKQMGFDNEYPDYVFDASDHSPEIWAEAQKIINDAEVVVLGSAPYSLLKSRMKEGKLTFRYSERPLKGYKHILKIPFYMLDNFKTKDCFLLCASAFAARDYNLMGGFRGKCFKWGYFTKVEAVGCENEIEPSTDEIVSLMWCSRFLKLKHPELPIYLAQELKRKGYRFVLDMYGTGRLLEMSIDLVNKLNLADVVRFNGNVSNEKLMQEMRRHCIFLFTSDRHEGWGAVANESMSNGCALVGSDKIGSVPYLVKDKENGCTFRSPSRLKGFCRMGLSIDRQSLSSLTEKVEWLINNPEERKRISTNAIITMRETWNPRTAAANFLSLIDDIMQGEDTHIMFGPCSKA